MGQKTLTLFDLLPFHYTTPSCPNNLLTQRLWGNFVTMSLAGQSMLSSFLNEVGLTQSG